jgi:hypothetical protein
VHAEAHRQAQFGEHLAGRRAHRRRDRRIDQHTHPMSEREAGQVGQADDIPVSHKQIQ